MANANKLAVLKSIMVKHAIWPYQLPETFGFAAPKRIAPFDGLCSHSVIELNLGNVLVKEEQVRIVVQVQSNASRNELLCFKEGVLHVRIAAPPIRGKANQELIKFLSETLRLSKTKLTIEKGMTSKRKVIAISELTQKQIIEQLERLGVGEKNAPADEDSSNTTSED